MHCPKGNETTYELDSIHRGGHVLHHMHAAEVQFSHDLYASHAGRHGEETLAAVVELDLTAASP
jgi:hypothetical protein